MALIEIDITPEYLLTAYERMKADGRIEAFVQSIKDRLQGEFEHYTRIDNAELAAQVREIPVKEWSALREKVQLEKANVLPSPVSPVKEL
jgi:hypothetical protein